MSQNRPMRNSSRGYDDASGYRRDQQRYTSGGSRRPAELSQDYQVLDDSANYKPLKGRSAKRAKKRRWPKVLIVLAVIAVAVAVMIPVSQRVYYKLEYQDLIQQAADTYDVNPYWIAAMVKCESNFDPEAVSKSGAVGLMQMMPETASDVARWGLIDTDKYSPDNLTDPETNINYGTAYLRYLVEYYHEMNPAIAAYNAGMGNVDAWLENGNDVRDVIEFPETASYLKSVNVAKEKYQELYPNAFVWNE